MTFDENLLKALAFDINDEIDAGRKIYNDK